MTDVSCTHKCTWPDCTRDDIGKQKPVAWSWIADPFTYIIQHLNSNPYNLTKDECVELVKKLRHLCAAPPAQPAPAQRLPLVQATAPREIWLQVSDDAEDKAEPFPENHDGITWCQDSVLSCEVRYVRADLAAAKDTL
jgi:hypothetical protein